MADKTYRVGVIGCGGMGRSHANNWKNTGRAEVVTASDISDASAAKFAEEFALPTHYTDFTEMCEKEDLDIVSITTWQSVRAEPTIAAAENGVLGVITEKPMAACVGDAQDMMNTCEKNDVKLVVGHQRRFQFAELRSTTAHTRRRDRSTASDASVETDTDCSIAAHTRLTKCVLSLATRNRNGLSGRSHAKPTVGNAVFGRKTSAWRKSVLKAVSAVSMKVIYRDPDCEAMQFTATTGSSAVVAMAPSNS